MEQKISRIPALLATVILSVAAFFLRSHQLKTAFDEVGVIAGSRTWVLTVFSIVAAALFAGYAWSLRSRKKYGSISSRELLPVGLSVAAALCLLLSSVLLLIGENPDLLVAVGGLAAAVCWIAVTLARYQGKKAHTVLFLIPAVFYVVDLICRFRLWTRDPVILDYCFDLLAVICTMCATFHLGGYCFEQGKRRLTVFYAMGGVFFSAIAMAGASAAELLGYLAAALWLLANLWLLLRPGKTRNGAEGREHAA